jgi:type II secretory pathway pseudopilin PulG
VVIVIIALLAGLLFPAIHAVQRSANQAVAAVEINQLDTALKLFKEKHGAYPPDFADVDREIAMQQVR